MWFAGACAWRVVCGRVQCHLTVRARCCELLHSRPGSAGGGAKSMCARSLHTSGRCDLIGHEAILLLLKKECQEQKWDGTTVFTTDKHTPIPTPFLLYHSHYIVNL